MFLKLSLPTIFILVGICFHIESAAQKMDTLIVSGKPVDSSHKRILKEDTLLTKFNPRVASLRSALIPGWGQAYNKKYWKIPIIYGALGVTTAVFFNNLKTYKLLRQAYTYLVDPSSRNGVTIDPRFKNLDPESIRTYRNYYRQNIDYSVLVFVAFWAINVVDATVDAHLKSFDVNDNISFKVRPDFNFVNKVSSLSIAFNIHEKHIKNYSIP